MGVDITADATLDTEAIPPAVSSLVLKAWYKDINAEDDDTANASIVRQVPDYEEYASWQELSQYIAEGGTPSPFEIA